MSDSKVLMDKYKIIKLIGKGAFGLVYLTEDNEGNNYASKVEIIKKKSQSRLKEEYKTYELINKNGFKYGHGLPRIHSFVKTSSFNLLIMELLGPSLETMFNKSKKTFTIGTIINLAINMISLLEKLHNAGFLHRDIKPANFMIGYGKRSNKLYMADFGLSKQYIKNGIHIPYNDKKSLVGTLRYASINTHLGIEQSRRDDLESLGYVLMYFANGSLPWQGLKKNDNEDQTALIGDSKFCTSVDKLCQGLHDNFKKYLIACKNLKFDEKPDYESLRNYFKQIATEKHINLAYQWNK